MKYPLCVWTGAYEGTKRDGRYHFRRNQCPTCTGILSLIMPNKIMLDAVMRTLATPYAA